MPNRYKAPGSEHQKGEKEGHGNFLSKSHPKSESEGQEVSVTESKEAQRGELLAFLLPSHSLTHPQIYCVKAHCHRQDGVDLETGTCSSGTDQHSSPPETHHAQTALECEAVVVCGGDAGFEGLGTADAVSFLGLPFRVMHPLHVLSKFVFSLFGEILFKKGQEQE